MCEFCKGTLTSTVIRSEITKDIMYLDGSYLITDLSRRRLKDKIDNSSFKIGFCPICGREL